MSRKWWISIHWRGLTLYLAPLLLSPLLFKAEEYRCGFVILLMSIYWITEACNIVATALLPLILFPLLLIMTCDEVAREYLNDLTMNFFGSIIIAAAMEHSRMHIYVSVWILRRCGNQPYQVLFMLMFTAMSISMWLSNTSVTVMMVPIVKSILKELDVIPKTFLGSCALLHKIKGSETVSVTSEVVDDILYHHSEDAVNQNELQQVESVLNQDLAETLTLKNENDVTTIQSDSFIRMIKLNPSQIEDLEMLDKYNDPYRRNFATMIALGTLYATVIGGVTTYAGTSCNHVGIGHIIQIAGNQKGLSFAGWFIFALPMTLLNTFLVSLCLYWLFLKGHKKPNDEGNVLQLTAARSLRVFHERHTTLPKLTFREQVILGLFAVLIIILFLREPKFFDGWEDWFPTDIIGESVPCMIIALLLFMLPNFEPGFWKKAKQKTKGQKVEFLLDWSVIETDMSWGVIVLMGGGLVMAKGYRVSGLSHILEENMKYLSDGVNPYLLFVIVIICCSIVTEGMLDSSACHLILPIVVQLATQGNVLYLSVPAIMACSFGFMLPVASPSNDIMFGSFNIKRTDMLKAGIIVKLICLTSLFLFFHTWGFLWFDES